MSLNGIDISSWQEGINISELATTDFVIVKATQGTSYVNPFFKEHYEAARAAGKLLGTYHYIEGGNAQAEALHFYNNVKGCIGEAVLCLDWEGNQNSAWGDTAYLEQVVTHVINYTGVKPLIYCSYSSYPWEVASRNDCGAWVAQYANYSETDYQESPWNEGAYSCAIRQYSSTGRIQGYGGNLDLNKAYMGAEAWGKYATAGGAVKPSASGNAPAQVSAGTYTCVADALNVRSAPSLSGAVVATYYYGETVNLDGWSTVADGYVWGRYISYSGYTRYIAVKAAGGEDYLVK